jgi:hypothetical protein
MNGVALLCRIGPANMPMNGMMASQPVSFMTPPPIVGDDGTGSYSKAW